MYMVYRTPFNKNMRNERVRKTYPRSAKGLIIHYCQSCWHLRLVDVCLNDLVCLLDLFVNPKFASNFTTQISQQTHFGRLSVRHVESYLMSDSSSIIPPFFERCSSFLFFVDGKLYFVDGNF